MRDNRPVIESTIDLFHAVMVEISRTKVIKKAHQNGTLSFC
jgi:hypothetical protein